MMPAAAAAAILVSDQPFIETRITMPPARIVGSLNDLKIHLQ
jgi:hypothetical protein